MKMTGVWPGLSDSEDSESQFKFENEPILVLTFTVFDRLPPLSNGTLMIAPSATVLGSRLKRRWCALMV